MKLSAITKMFRRQTTSGNWIPEVDGLRFIAIMSVILFHIVEQMGHHPHQEQARYSLFLRATGSGYRGVQLFYTLSGYILGRPFANYFLLQKPWPSIKKYFTRRVTRLEPPYILNLCVAAVGVILIEHYSWHIVLPRLAASILYLHHFLFPPATPPTIFAWSLEVEIQFYILAPLLACLFAIRQATLRRSIFAALMFGSGALQFHYQFINANILAQLHYFLAGLLLADLAITVLPHCSHHWWWDLVSLVGWPTLFLLSHTYHDFWLPALTLVLYIAGFRGRVMYSFLRTTWIAVIGGMCYTIYLWHGWVMTLVQIAFFNRIPWLTPNEYMLAFLLHFVIEMFFISIVCLTMYLLIEKPCMDPEWPRKLRHRLFPQRQQEQTVLQPD